jgi:acetylornithine deacetylase
MDETIARRVEAAADKGGEASIAFLRELIALAEQGETAVQDRIAAELTALGCEVERMRYRPEDVAIRDEFAASAVMAREERESIVARARGTGGGRSLIFFAHPDGEPARDLERWTRAPYAGVIDGGRLHGFGVSDDLAGVAGFVRALAAVRAADLAPAGDVILCSTPSKRHARGVFHVLGSGVRADAAVYMHPAESGVGMREIKAVASGIVQLRVTVVGRLPETREPGHTAFAHLSVNPLDKAILLIAALNRLGEARAARVRHPHVEAAVGRATNVLVANLQCGAPGKTTRVAAECVFGASVSFPPGEKLDDVVAEIGAAIEAAAKADPWLAEHPPRVEWLAGVTGAEIPLDHPLYTTVGDVVRRVTGEAPFVNPLHTSSDIRVPIVQAGIPTVGLGPLGGDLTQNGAHDEWVDVADYVRSVKVAALIVGAWCGAAAG